MGENPLLLKDKVDVELCQKTWLEIQTGTDYKQSGWPGLVKILFK